MELHSLAVSLAKANTHFYIGRKLDEARRGDFSKELYKSLDFWDYTIRAHIQAASLHLCRVYDDHLDDKRGRTHHLLRFVEKIDDANLTEAQKQQKQADLNFLQREDRKQNKRPDTKVAKFRAWRKKLFAHNDYDLAIDGLDDFLKKYPLDFQEIQSLIDDGFAILEKWAAHHHFRGEIKRLVEFKDDYQFVLESLRFRLLQQPKQKSN